VSRVFLDVVAAPHAAAAVKLRALLAAHEDAADLIQIGAYAAGASPQVDRAVQLLPAVHAFLRQPRGAPCSWNDTRAALQQLADAWPFAAS
jgi:flagellar biosynthesis/type III secretory pathway ATPase